MMTKGLILIMLAFILSGCVEENIMQNTEEIVTKQLEYRETNGIPICPYCQKPTERTGGTGTTTLMWFYPIYDKNGTNTNPDRNTATSTWRCNECNNDYTTSGNYIDGYRYGGL